MTDLVDAKVNEAKGLVLDWLVAVALPLDHVIEYGPEDFREQRRHTVKNGEYIYRWSDSWNQAGELIEEFNISLQRKHNGWWMASIQYNYADEPEFLHLDHKPLTAAMRCLVSSRLGPVVKVPAGLLENHP